MSGSATPQNPILPEDPFIIIGTKLSLDPTQQDAAVPSVGIGVAGGVVPLDADGQVPLQFLRNLIAHLGGTYTPPPDTGGTGTGTGTGGTTGGGTTTPTTPVTPAPATIADALALVDGAYLADGDGAVLLFPTGEPASGAGSGTDTGTDTGGGGTTTPTPTPATVADALALADGAHLADGDGAVLLFPVGATGTGGEVPGSGADTGTSPGGTTGAATTNATVVLPDGATLSDGDGVILLFPVPADTTADTGGGVPGLGTGTGTTATPATVVLPDGNDLILPGGDTLILPAA